MGGGHIPQLTFLSESWKFGNHGRRTQGERASDRRVQAQRSSPTANKGGSIARRNE